MRPAADQPPVPELPCLLERVDARVGAVALSVPLAAATCYYVLAGLEYFVVGPFALGLVEAVSRAIPLF